MRKLLFYISVLSILTANASDYYIRPTSTGGNGTQENPFGSLEEALSSVKETAGGDRFLLASGNYGSCTIRGAMSGFIQIMAEEGAQPVFEQITFENAARWRIMNVTITGQNKPYCVSTDSLCQSIQMVGCNLGIPAISDEWSREDWKKVPDGLILRGKRHRVLLNHFQNVNTGIRCYAPQSIVSQNKINFFTGRGIEIFSGFGSYENNLIKNAVNLYDNENYGILIQGTNGQSISQLKINGNAIYNYTNYTRHFIGPMGGIASFNAQLSKINVESNLVICDHWHGISLFKLKDSFIANNTIIDPYLGTTYPEEQRASLSGPIGPCRLWIDNQEATSSNNIITNNLVSDMRIIGTHALESNNLVVESSYSALDETFMNWSVLDFRLRPGATYVHAGLKEASAQRDITGFMYNRNEPVNVGAYMNTQIEAVIEELTLVGKTTDMELRSNGQKEWDGQPMLRVGGTSDKYGSNIFLPFVLPSLPNSAKIAQATLSVNLEAVQNGPSGNVDLFALVPKDIKDIAFADYFVGSYQNAQMVRLIQPAFLTPHSPIGNISTTSTGSSALADYINTLYQSGAKPGDTFILRLNHTDNNIRAYSRWQVSSANNVEHAPHIHLKIDNQTDMVQAKQLFCHVYPSPSFDGTAEFRLENNQPGETIYITIKNSHGETIQTLSSKENVIPTDVKNPLERGSYMAQVTCGNETKSIAFYIW